jgi:hypothetical protein
VLASELSDGDHIKIAVEDDRLTFERQQPAEQASVPAIAEVSRQAA